MCASYNGPNPLWRQLTHTNNLFFPPAPASLIWCISMAVFTLSLCCQSDWILSGEFRFSHFWSDQIDSWHSHMSPHTIIPGNPPVFRLLARLNLLGFFCPFFSCNKSDALWSDQKQRYGTSFRPIEHSNGFVQMNSSRSPSSSSASPSRQRKIFHTWGSRVANIFDGALTQRQHLCEGVLQMSLGYFQEVRQVQKTSAN